MIMWFIGVVSFVFGVFVGVGLTLLAQQRNDVGMARRNTGPRLSTLDLFELPESIQKHSSYPPTTTSTHPPKDETHT